MEERILLTECADATGIISKVTSECFNYQVNIVHQDQFATTDDNRFFMRTVLEGDFSCENELVQSIRDLLPADAKVRLVSRAKKRIAVLVTKEAHVLGDLLIKSYSDAMRGQIVMVAGNHPDLRELVEKFDIPFHYVPTEGISREEHEERMCQLIDEANVDYVVLAKYMRILSEKMVARYPLGKLINIHHSFLPAFIGAKPYQQAFDRGVKIIGATAHFVTNNLDEGPIIEQDVIKVNHRYDARTMAKAGRDVERLVLFRALSRVLEDKVFIHGNKTVVF